MGDFGADPALVASQSNPQAVSTKGFDPGEGFLLKAWDVTVEGYGVARFVAATRGKALSKAWRCDAFNRLTFGDFLKIATAFRALIVSDRFGEPITVLGKPAFYVGEHGPHIRFVRPGETETFVVHPSDVAPLARIEAGTDETAKLAQPEGREPDKLQTQSSTPDNKDKQDG